MSDEFVFLERTRKSLGALPAFLFHLECAKGYIRALDDIGAARPEFAPWIERERTEIIKNEMRKNYELRFTDKNHPNLYREAAVSDRRIMEHVIPISHWCQLYLAAPEELKDGVFFMGWAGPIANVTKGSDLFFKGTGEVFFNRSLVTPFERYRRAGFEVRQAFPDATTEGFTLAMHYARLDRIEFLAPLMSLVREKHAFEEALAWVQNQDDTAAAAA